MKTQIAVLIKDLTFNLTKWFAQVKVIRKKNFRQFQILLDKTYTLEVSQAMDKIRPISQKVYDDLKMIGTVLDKFVLTISDTLLTTLTDSTQRLIENMEHWKKLIVLIPNPLFDDFYKIICNFCFAILTNICPLGQYLLEVSKCQKQFSYLKVM